MFQFPLHTLAHGRPVYLERVRFFDLTPTSASDVERAAVYVGVGDTSDDVAPVMEAVVAARPGDGAVAGDLSMAQSRTDCTESVNAYSKQSLPKRNYT